MRPIPLHNTWPERRRKLLMAFLLTVIAIAGTRPNSLIGLAIALSTIPPLCLALLSLRWWWHRKFGGSKFMGLAGFLIMISIGIALSSIASILPQEITHHFSHL